MFMIITNYQIKTLYSKVFCKVFAYTESNQRLLMQIWLFNMILTTMQFIILCVSTLSVIALYTLRHDYFIVCIKYL